MNAPKANPHTVLVNKLSCVESNTSSQLTKPDCLLDNEQDYAVLKNECPRASESIINQYTGEVLRSNECDNNKCVQCAPIKARRVARHAAWVLSAAPYVWSVTVSPVSDDSSKVPMQITNLARRWRSHGQLGYMYSVEQESLSHAHLFVWSDFDLAAVQAFRQGLHIERVTDTFADRLRVARYLTKTVHQDNDLAKHLVLNRGRLVRTSSNFWYGFLDYRHVKREYRAQQGWLPGSEPNLNSITLTK